MSTGRAIPHPVPHELAEVIARRFRVIGDPIRIRLLDSLRDGEQSVQELTEALEANQQNVSKHLSILAEAGIVGRRKQGNRVYYGIVDEGVFELCEQVCGALEQQLEELADLIGGRTADEYRGSADSQRSRNHRPLTLERVLFALAGTMTLLSAVLAALVSPWFLLLTAFVGVNQWLYVTVGACPASIVVKRLTGLDCSICRS